MSAATSIHDISTILRSFQPIDLKGMDAIRLLNRVDTKAYMHLDKLPALLEAVRDDYSVLTVNDIQLAAYDSLYFDTPDLDLYMRHHNKQLNRYKIRYRNYVESNLTFFEVKFKSNKGRTIKKRIVVPKIEKAFGEKAQGLLEDYPTLTALNLQPKLRIFFRRMTLAHKNFEERATIDVGLSFESDGQKVDYQHLVICEVKQGRFNRNAPLIRALKDIGIIPKRISKYCTGIISCNAGIKSNRFQHKMMQLQKIENS